MNFAGETAQNYEQKCLCVLVLDTSGSMNEIVDASNCVDTGRTQTIDGQTYRVVNGGVTRLEKLREGLATFYQEIENDEMTSQKLEIAVITFNDTVKIVQQPSLIEDCPPPLLNASGITNIAGAVTEAMELVEARKSWYKTTKQLYYRPWIILITDGEPNAGQDMDSLAATIKQEVNLKHFEFLPIGVDNANMAILQKLSANIPALPLQGAKFIQFFKWLSASMSTIVDTKQGERVNIAAGADDWINKFSNYEI